VLAAAVLEAMLDADAPVTVGYAAGSRYSLSAVLDDAGAASPTSIGPLGSLGTDGVAVLTGGARGVTASLARSIAAANGCHLVLIGRSALPDEDEDPSFAGAEDDGALRRAIIATGVREPREVEAALRRIKGDREIRATLADLATTAASVHYRSADVRDRAALATVLDEVLDDLGRVDLVVHGAGVLDDKLVRDKTPEAFADVYDTKVTGATAAAAWLVEHAAVDRPATLVLMGSVSGVFGNRGQTDYAAANDALDLLAHVLADHPGVRPLSVDWGPWGGGGMVSPELEREYERRGVGLLDPADAAGRLLAELAADRPERGRNTPQVVIMRVSADAFGEASG
jgi:NAD(P)-dependent dehydrogenase (short-subunit alcohol dehydrogenase family)